MKTITYIAIAVLSSVMLTSCVTTDSSNTQKTTNTRAAMVPKNATKVVARITYYTKYEDRFGSRIACSPKLRAKEGETVAAHRNFPFWKRVFIPGLQKIVGDGDGVFVIQDRGKHVNSKKASRGKAYVFDVYLNRTNSQMRRFASTVPRDMEVYIY